MDIFSRSIDFLLLPPLVSSPHAPCCSVAGDIDINKGCEAAPVGRTVVDELGYARGIDLWLLLI